MQRNKFVKAVCIFLAILMLGSVLIGVIQAFALTPGLINIVYIVDKVLLLV